MLREEILSSDDVQSRWQSTLRIGMAGGSATLDGGSPAPCCLVQRTFPSLERGSHICKSMISGSKILMSKSSSQSSFLPQSTKASEEYRCCSPNSPTQQLNHQTLMAKRMSYPSERPPSITACGMSRRDVHLASPCLVPVGNRTKTAAIALRTESPESSSGLKVLSVLVNTDQMYAL